MRVSKISYSRLKNIGNFQHEKVDVEIELQKGDDPTEAMKACKGFVNKELGYLPSQEQVDSAKKIIEDYESQTNLFPIS